MMDRQFMKKIRTVDGFTLVEILIATFILSVVMATVYLSYTSTLKTARQLEEEREIYKMARVTMDRIIKDLSSLQPSEDSFDLRAQKEKIGGGEFHSLSLWSASHLAFGENATEGRPAAISYYVREDEGGKSFSLWRTDVSDAKPDRGKTREEGFLLCRNVNKFNLSFFDSTDAETDSWDSSATWGEQKGNVPAAVKIELFLANLNDPEKPYKFMTRVFLPVRKTP